METTIEWVYITWEMYGPRDDDLLLQALCPSQQCKSSPPYHVIRLIHEFSITGSIARQPLLMADQACNCWFFFISNKFNGLIFNMEYDT